MQSVRQKVRDAIGYDDIYNLDDKIRALNPILRGWGQLSRLETSSTGPSRFSDAWCGAWTCAGLRGAATGIAMHDFRRGQEGRRSPHHTRRGGDVNERVFV
jgi:hypothetical protein